MRNTIKYFLLVTNLFQNFQVCVIALIFYDQISTGRRVRLHYWYYSGDVHKEHEHIPSFLQAMCYADVNSLAPGRLAVFSNK